jgi:hypothetical protein
MQPEITIKITTRTNRREIPENFIRRPYVKMMIKTFGKKNAMKVHSIISNPAAFAYNPGTSSLLKQSAHTAGY